MVRLKILGFVWPTGGPSKNRSCVLFAPATLQGEGAGAMKREKGVWGFSGVPTGWRWEGSSPVTMPGLTATTCSAWGKTQGLLPLRAAPGTRRQLVSLWNNLSSSGL